MRNQFDTKLAELSSDLITMGAMIETAISQAITALRSQDYELAQKVLASDNAVDELELKIERQAMMILLSEQPVAKDLRTISTALKMITDMERISDQAVDIAEIVLSMPKGSVQYPEKIKFMAQRCVIMVSESITAFIDNNLELAAKVIADDDEIDELFEQVKQELVQAIRASTGETPPILDFLMIAKYLERIGDHSTNIAEWVQFNITGVHKEHRIL